MAHAYNPSTSEPKQEDQDFDASLGYMRLCGKSIPQLHSKDHKHTFSHVALRTEPEALQLLETSTRAK